MMPFLLGALGKRSERKICDRFRKKKLKYFAQNEKTLKMVQADYTPHLILLEKENLEKKYEKQKEVSAKFGKLSIYVQKAQYFPGDNLVGYIFLDLFQENKGSKIYLTLKGSQIYQYTNEEMQTKITSAMKSARVSNASDIDNLEVVEEFIFYNHKYLVYENRERLAAGAYIFPFEIRLHKSLPRSAEIIEKEVSMLINYKLIAHFSLNENEFLLEKIPLEIMHEPPLLRMDIKISEFNNQVTSFICYSRKDISIEVFLRKNIASAGGSIDGFSLITSSSKSLPFNNLRLKITRFIHLQLKKDIDVKKSLKKVVVDKVINLKKYVSHRTDNTHTVGFVLDLPDYVQPTVYSTKLKIKYFITGRPDKYRLGFKEKSPKMKAAAQLFVVKEGEKFFLDQSENEDKWLQEQEIKLQVNADIRMRHTKLNLLANLNEEMEDFLNENEAKSGNGTLENESIVLD